MRPFVRTNLRLCLAASALALAAAFFLPTSLLAAEAITAGDLSLLAPFSRATPPGARVGGGYVTITNNGTAPDRLVGAEAAFAERVEIHDMKVEDGVMRMTPLPDGLVIQPGESVALKPGSFHLMFMRLRAPLVEGENRSVTLVFERAGRVELTIPVGSIAARAAPGKDAHGDRSGQGTAKE